MNYQELNNVAHYLSTVSLTLSPTIERSALSAFFEVKREAGRIVAVYLIDVCADEYLTQTADSLVRLPFFGCGVDLIEEIEANLIPQEGR